MDDLIILYWNRRLRAGQWDPDNFWALCRRRGGLWFWMEPRVHEEYFWPRFKEKTAAEAIYAAGTINPERMDWEGALCDPAVVSTNTIPAMIGSAFTSGLSRYDLAQFFGTKVFLNSRPIPIGTIGDLILRGKTIH